MANSFNELIARESILIDKQEHSYQKLGIVFNLIELKIQSSKESDKKDIFIYLKKMINFYIDSIDETYFGYYDNNDENSNKLLEKIAYVSVEEQLNLIDFLQRRLRIAGFIKESEVFDKNREDLKLRLLLRKKYKNIFKILGYISTRNLFSLFISILLIYLIYTTMLLPAPLKSMELFQLTYQKYSSNFLINHFSNTLLSFCQIDSRFSIIPNSFLGVVVLIIMKLSILVLLFNFLINEFKRKIKFP